MDLLNKSLKLNDVFYIVIFNKIRNSIQITKSIKSRYKLHTAFTAVCELCYKKSKPKITF